MKPLAFKYESCAKQLKVNCIAAYLCLFLRTKQS